MNKITPPKYPTFYLSEHLHFDTVAVWYPNGKSEFLNTKGEWEDGGNWFIGGPEVSDIKICEIQ